MWRQLSVVASDSIADEVSDAFVDCGAVAVSFEDAADQPLYEPKPGEVRIWRRTRVIGLFPSEADLSAVTVDVQARFGRSLGSWLRDELEDRPWERVWLEHFQPMRYGRRLWVCPTGFDLDRDGGNVILTLDPGLAFGTGTHPTTTLCLEWLDSEPSLHGARVIDYGCGSGILAVAALLLGAAQAEAVDIDPQALTATLENARKNGLAGQIRCGAPEILDSDPKDVLLANILANPLIELAPRLASLVKGGGRIVLSGILSEQGPEVAAAYEPWFHSLVRKDMDGWVRWEGTRRH